jgi:hypothetical protein
MLKLDLQSNGLLLVMSPGSITLRLRISRGCTRIRTGIACGYGSPAIESSPSHLERAEIRWASLRGKYHGAGTEFKYNHVDNSVLIAI